MKDSKYEA